MTEITLNDKIVVITGAGSGLGEATANAFAAAGSTVVCLDINQEAITRVSTEIEAHQGRALPLRCDVSSADSIFSTVQAIHQQCGRIDILVNCAAVDFTYSVEEMSIEQWNKALAINLSGPFLFAKAVFPIMRQNHEGHIINIGSTASLRAWANASVYHATKWGLLGFSRSLGVEGRKDGIRVTTIIPGGMRTHFFDRFEAQGIPMPDPENLQDPATVADAIIYAVKVPRESTIQEMLLTPMNETSWP